MTSRRALGLACLLVSVAVPSAHADVVRAGGSLIAIAAASRGSAVAYDSTNRVYLVVSTMGVLRGRFVQADGTPVGAAFGIQSTGNYTHFPRVAFSPEAADATGGFLVTWHESDLPAGTSIHGRMVSVSAGGAYGPDTNLSADGAFWEVGAAVAYGSGSREFLVAWRKLAGNDIRAVRVGLDSTPKGAVFNVTATPTQYEDNPSVAYNVYRNEFLVVYAGFNDPGNYAFVDSQRVQAGADGMMGSAVRLIQTAGTYITDVSHNSQTGRYLAAWYSLPGGAAFGRVVEGDGSLGSGIITLSTRWKAYDALSVAFNIISNSFYMVSHSSGVEDGGVELDTNGTPIDNGLIVTGAGGTGNFYPRVAASADQPEWLLSTANSFTSTMVQRLVGTPSGGVVTPPPPPPTTSNPRMSLDVPSSGSTTAGNFTVAGWALDLASTTDGGVDAVHVWAYPNPGSGAAALFLGAAAMGVSRPDVGAAFGSRFSSTGFVLDGALAPGTYDVAVFAHSSVAGVFNNSQTARIQVLAPPSIPRMFVDLPAQNQSVSQNLVVAGWALDVGAVTGTGVDAVHVWAYPVAGGAPVFAGVATLGHSRSDIAAAFGAARFAAGGFRLDATLPRGEYNLVVFAHSVNTNTFNNAALVRIRVL